MAVHPSNLNSGFSSLKADDKSPVSKPLSLSKKRKDTTPIRGGVATGISKTDEKNDLKGSFLY